MKRVVRKTTATLVAEELELAITTGELAPGSKLPSEVKLSAKVGCGVDCLREAISRLIGKGLLISVHGIGTFVTHKETAQSVESLAAMYRTSGGPARRADVVRHFLELRRMIMAEVFCAACARATPAQLDRLSGDLLNAVGAAQFRGDVRAALEWELYAVQRVATTCDLYGARLLTNTLREFFIEAHRDLTRGLTAEEVAQRAYELSKHVSKRNAEGIRALIDLDIREADRRTLCEIERVGKAKPAMRTGYEVTEVPLPAPMPSVTKPTPEGTALAREIAALHDLFRTNNPRKEASGVLPDAHVVHPAIADTGSGGGEVKGATAPAAEDPREPGIEAPTGAVHSESATVPCTTHCRSSCADAFASVLATQECAPGSGARGATSTTATSPIEGGENAETQWFDVDLSDDVPDSAVRTRLGPDSALSASSAESDPRGTGAERVDGESPASPGLLEHFQSLSSRRDSELTSRFSRDASSSGSTMESSNRRTEAARDHEERPEGNQSHVGPVLEMTSSVVVVRAVYASAATTTTLPRSDPSSWYPTFVAFYQRNFSCNPWEVDGLEPPGDDISFMREFEPGLPPNPPHLPNSEPDAEPRVSESPTDDDSH